MNFLFYYSSFNCFVLGCILGIVMEYPKLIHGCNSKDVVKSKFVGRDGQCWKFKPRVVTCEWHQTPLEKSKAINRTANEDGHK